MSERVKLTKEMFVARMLADQNKRREARRKKADDDLYCYFKSRDLRMRKNLNQNTASKYYKRGGKR